jgi:hypothetical protein
VVVLLAWLASGVGAAAQGPNDRPTAVEPSDLTRRADLVGRDVVVDDRVSRFQYHKETDAIDQVFLKRCPEVPFDLPPRLRTKRSPQAPAVLIRGVLQRDGDRWRVDVTGMDLLPSDLDRLNAGVATLPRSDTEKRFAWVRWAERRARAFAEVDKNNEIGRSQDEALLKRAREIEAETIRAEAERPGRDPAGHWLALASKARERQVAEPEPSALAHRGFRAALAGAHSADDLKAVVGRIEAFFPGAKDRPSEADPAELARWERPYAHDPSDAYRSASPAARRALDHRLWADAVQKAIGRQAADRPESLLTLAEEASRRLPDRPEVARALLENGLGRAGEKVGALRLSEVEALARLYEETLKQPDRAKGLVQAWLDDQRGRRLSPRDAEARVTLAQHYERLLGDRETAGALLQDAWKIDPQSRQTSDAFLRLGYRKLEGRWVAPTTVPALAAVTAPERPGDQSQDDAVRPEPSNGPERPAPPADRPASPTDSLLNNTPEQVIARMGGRPNRRVRVATQGRLIEQWVYSDPRTSQYITFLQRPGDSHPRVVSRYTLPRGELTSSAAP